MPQTPDPTAALRSAYALGLRAGAELTDDEAAGSRDWHRACLVEAKRRAEPDSRAYWLGVLRASLRP